MQNRFSWFGGLQIHLPIRHAWLLPLLLLVAFGLRIFHLGAHSFWFDEGWSWHLASLPLREMAGITAGDRNPVLYYVLLHGWLGLVGDSEFVLRYLALLPDVITVALVWAIAKRLQTARGIRWSPYVATVLYALCPFAVWYAQETRMYAQIAMLCTASSYALLRWLSQPPRATRWLVGSAVCLAAALHSHYYAVFLLPAHALVVMGHSVREGRRSLFQWLIAAAAVIASVVPWLLLARGGFAYNDGFDFPLNTVAGRMLEWVRAFVSGGFGYPLPEWWPILCAFVVGIALLAAWRNPRLWTALGLALIPLLSAAIAVRVVYPYRSVFHPRYLIFVAPLLCVFLAGGFKTNKLLRLPFAFGLLLLWLPALVWHFTQPSAIRDDTRGAIRHVVEAIEPGDVIVMSRDNFAVNYYWPKIAAQVGKNAPLLSAPEGLHGVLHDELHLIDQINHVGFQPKRVRLILWQDDVVDPQKLVESTLWQNGYQIGEYNFGRIRLPLYHLTTPTLQPLRSEPVGVTLGDQLVLQSAWQPPQATAGDWFYVVLWWQPIQPLLKNYKVFVHVLDADNKPVFQDDRLPLNDLLPMTRWSVGQTLRAPHAMIVPADLPAGRYRVFVGVYDPATGERLKTADGQDQIGLPMVQIVRP